MSELNLTEQFVDKHGHLKTFDQSNYESTTFVHDLFNKIKLAIQYTSFNAEGMHRPVDHLSFVLGKSGGEIRENQFEMDNFHDKIIKVSLYSKYISRSDKVEFSYNINFQVIYVEDLNVINFDNLSIKEFREYVSHVRTNFAGLL